MKKPSHIFITGVNRTGTNLMRQILNCSDQIAISGETHYLKHWVGFRGYRHEFSRVADIQSDEGAKKVVDYLYKMGDNYWRNRNFWGWVQRNVDRDEFLQRLLASDRSDHAMLDVAMTIFAGHKPIQGDKTPAHIHSVPTLLDWYPEAKVIHMFRDLRAIFVSEKRRQSIEYITLPYRILGRSQLLLEMSLSTIFIIHWLQAIQLHRRYQQRFPDQYYLCRFEDLTGDPEGEVEKLCHFLGIEFDRQMLELSYQNSSLVPRHQAQGIDVSTSNRWRNYLHPLTNRWLLLWSKKYLVEFGYQL